MGRSKTTSLNIASSMFKIPIRKYGNFATEQAMFVHKLRQKVNQIQYGFHEEGMIFYNKIKFKETMEKARIKIPKTYAYINDFSDFDSFWKAQKDLDEFVFKPNHLSQGKHIHVVHKEDGKYFDIDGKPRSTMYFRDLAEKILKGRHAHRGLIMEEVIHCHEKLVEWYDNKGIADFRIYCAYDTLMYGKLRLPTARSGFLGNTGKSAVAFFIDKDGVICESDLMSNIDTKHPDTQIKLIGQRIPYWDDIETIVLTVAKMFKIPFHSVDLTINDKGEVIVIEAEKIPLLRHFTKRGCIELMQYFDERRGRKLG
jgi:hypothetical protein